MKRNMIRLSIVASLVACALWISGCLPFPLGAPETSKLDPKIEGYWFNKQDEDKQTLVSLFPYDNHTYVLQWVDFKKSGDEFVPTSIQIFKAWLTPVKNAQFITMEPLAQRLASSASDKKWYYVSRLVPEGDGLLVKPVDTDFKPFENVKSAEDVMAVIQQNLDDPKLYSSNPTHFRHMDVEKDKDALEPMMKVFK